MEKLKLISKGNKKNLDRHGKCWKRSVDETWQNYQFVFLKTHFKFAMGKTCYHAVTICFPEKQFVLYTLQFCKKKCTGHMANL